MRFKDHVLNKLTQLDALVNRLQVQANRGTSQEELLQTAEMMKQQIENVREMVSVENSDFEQQFAR